MPVLNPLPEGYPNVPRSERTYKHSGDLGDIVYYGAVMKYLGGGTLAIAAAKFTRQGLTPDKYAPIVPLFESQDYCDAVVPFNENMKVFSCGDSFRRFLKAGTRTQVALCDLMCDAAHVPRTARDVAWLKVEPKPVANVVINRTARWPNHAFPWRTVWDKFHKEAVFIGTKDEHETFEGVVGKVDYYPTPDLLLVAQVIAGSALFVGNQSCPYAICEGLKHPAVLEVCRPIANCLFTRDSIWHGWGGDMELPELEGDGK